MFQLWVLCTTLDFLGCCLMLCRASHTTLGQVLQQVSRNCHVQSYQAFLPIHLAHLTFSSDLISCRSVQNSSKKKLTYIQAMIGSQQSTHQPSPIDLEIAEQTFFVKAIYINLQIILCAVSAHGSSLTKQYRHAKFEK